MSDISYGSSDAAATAVREQRPAMLLQVRCSVTHGAFFTIMVRNLSSHGLGGRCLQKVNIRDGEPVTISFRNVSPITARVIWFQGGDVGIQFDAPVDLARIADARNWNGPEFAVDNKHEIAGQCYRPGFAR
jgi:hypothetical protein